MRNDLIERSIQDHLKALESVYQHCIERILDSDMKSQKNLEIEVNTLTNTLIDAVTTIIENLELMYQPLELAKEIKEQNNKQISELLNEQEKQLEKTQLKVLEDSAKRLEKYEKQIKKKLNTLNNLIEKTHQKYKFLDLKTWLDRLIYGFITGFGIYVAYWLFNYFK